jgi:hypothetical protein
MYVTMTMITLTGMTDYKRVQYKSRIYELCLEIFYITLNKVSEYWQNHACLYDDASDTLCF